MIVSVFDYKKESPPTISISSWIWSAGWSAAHRYSRRSCDGGPCELRRMGLLLGRWRNFHYANVQLEICSGQVPVPVWWNFHPDYYIYRDRDNNLEKIGSLGAPTRPEGFVGAPRVASDAGVFLAQRGFRRSHPP